MVESPARALRLKDRGQSRSTNSRGVHAVALLELVAGNPNRAADAEVLQVAALADAIHGRSARSEQLGDLANRKRGLSRCRRPVLREAYQEEFLRENWMPSRVSRPSHGSDRKIPLRLLTVC